jgi:hypothetical protein
MKAVLVVVGFIVEQLRAVESTLVKKDISNNLLSAEVA